MNVCYDYLRPRKAALLRQRYREYEMSDMSERYACVKDGIVVPVFHGKCELQYGVCDSYGRLEVLSNPDGRQEVEDYVKGLHPDKRSGKCMYVGRYNPHYGHFITDCLSMFWLMGRVDVDRYVFSAEKGDPPEIAPNIKECLRLLGVWDKIGFVTDPVMYDTVYVPRRGMMPRDYIIPSVAGVYARIVCNATKACADVPCARRVIMCRSRFPKAIRNDLGTLEMERFFIDNGFYPVYPEQMSLVSLIQVLQNAEEIAAISGTLPHNLVFAQAGCRVYVVEKYANINNYQQGIDMLMNLDITFIDAFLLVYSVDPGLGPFILTGNKFLKRFAEDHDMRYEIRPIGISRKLRKYFRLFHRHYRRQWILPEWIEPEIGLLREAYDDSIKTLGPWLEGKRSIYFSDWFSLRFIKRRLMSLIDKRN